MFIFFKRTELFFLIWYSKREETVASILPYLFKTSCELRTDPDRLIHDYNSRTLL